MIRNLGPMLIAASVIISATLFGAAALPATEYAFITTSDYETGSAAEILLDGYYTTHIGIADIHSDAIARWYNGLVYVVSRAGGDNITVLDPDDGFSVLRQYSTGNGTNPQDIAFRSETKAYISTFDTNELLIMDTISGEITGSIDLSSFADGDGLCEMAYLYIKHDILFVAIQRIDRNYYWTPVGDSYVAVVDCAADTLIDCDPDSPGLQSIPLTGTNPYSEIRLDPVTEKLHVSCVGWWGMQDCGIEIVNPFTLQSEGYLFTETAAGGDINDFDILGAAKGYAIVTNSSFYTELVSFDPAAGSKTAVLYAPGDYVINDIEISPDGELFLADQTPTDPGIRIFDTASDTEITSSPIYTGLPPFDICFSVPSYTDAGDTPLAAFIGRNYPNPFNPFTTIPFSTGRPQQVDISVYDPAGRKIRVLTSRFYEAGTHKVEWDGTDDRGSPVASGVYFARFTSGEITDSKKLILLR